MSDTGLLTSLYPRQHALELLDGRATGNMGAVYENFVAQELTAHGFELRYFHTRKVGELDFVVERKGGTIMAFEVKSGSNYLTHAALNNAMKVKEYDISEAYVLAETNVVKDGAVRYLPLYMSMFFMNDE
jgi:predicted AAA+ superfamily ATPase